MADDGVVDAATDDVTTEVAGVEIVVGTTEEDAEGTDDELTGTLYPGMVVLAAADDTTCEYAAVGIAAEEEAGGAL